MHWLTIVGIILIAVGTFFTYIGQSRSSKSDVLSLQTSIDKKNTRIDKLIESNNNLNVRIGEYQKTVSDKDKIIEKLQVEVDKLNVTAPKLLPDGRIAASPHVFMASEFSDGANRARDLFNKGDYNGAYRIAEELKKKNPDFGLAFFLLGTIDIQRGNTDKGKEYIEHSLKLELSDGDRAWAFHNLGIIALRNQNIDRAVGYLNQAIQINPKMEESKKMLKSIENQLKKNNP
ncbi:MAG: tetratricopeptide repeat protein [bacterium]